jgi:DNA repair exonuclease SbcCD ATPase subunit
VIQEKQRASDESERASSQLRTLKEQSIAQREEIEHAIDVARKKRTSHQKTLMQDEQKLETTRERRGQLAGPLSQLGIFEEQSKKLKSIDEQLAKSPKDIEVQTRQAQEALDRCLELGTVAPLLDRFAAARLQLREATRRSEELELAEQSTLKVGEKAKAEHAKLKSALDAAVTARQQADSAATEAKTLLQQAKAAADEFEKLEGAKTCRACGQALTPAHWVEEKSKRVAEWQAGVARNRETAAAQTKAVAGERDAREQCDAAERELQRLREEYRDAKKERELAAKDIERLTLECRDSYRSLPDAYRDRVSKQSPSDWCATTWPRADEQRAIKNQAAELDAARRRATELRERKSLADRLAAEREAASGIRDQIKSQLPPGEPAELRQEEARLKAEEIALNDSIRGTKKLSQDTDIEIEQRNKKLAEAHKAIANIDSQLSVEEEKRTAHKDAIERASRMIPATWLEPVAKAGLAEQNRWKAELESLNREGTEAKYQELTQTRASIDQVQQDIALTQEAANAIVDEARRPSEDFKSLLATARTVVIERAEELQKAREEKAVLDRHRAERERLRGQSLLLEKDLNFNVLLTQLLGRDRLQRHLVRTAEKQIVDYANSILDRLSGGQLFLRLCGSDDGATERALELEAYNRMTGSTPINVAFLSGSQRFRVAVSLALGIGQYASRQHRPIESVIIDEGFGCLDRNGRQVMIQELQNLRGHLKCILLVSHQEEFADAFADGYRFELADGMTRVTRFQK